MFQQQQLAGRESMMSVTAQLATAVYVAMALFAVLALLVAGDPVSFLVLCALQWLQQAFVHYVRLCVRESERKSRFFSALLQRLLFLDLGLFLPLALLLLYLQSARLWLCVLPPAVAVCHLAWCRYFQQSTATHAVDDGTV